MLTANNKHYTAIYFKGGKTCQKYVNKKKQ